MMSLADRTGSGQLRGETGPAIGGNIRSGALVLGSNNRAHYGFAQVQAEKWLLNSTAIPNLVLPPIWTGLETRVDEGVSLPFYGPAIAGQAKTWKVPQWVGNYLGTQQVRTDKGKLEWRLYTTEYRGEDQVPHQYKIRSEPGIIPEFLKDDDGKPFSGFNLGIFFDLLARAKQDSIKRVKEVFPDAPGMGMGVIGGPELKTQTPAAGGPSLPRAAALPRAK